MLCYYPGSLYLLLFLVLQFGYLLEYTSPTIGIILNNPASTQLNSQIITEKLKDNSLLGRLIRTIQGSLFNIVPTESHIKA